MPFGGLLTGGVMALSGLGGLFSNRGGTSKQTQSTTGQQTVDMNNMPQYDPKSQSLRDLLINLYMDNLKSNDDYFKGYTLNGVNEINKTADSSQHSIENLLASRGIQGPAAGAGLTAPLIQRQNLLSSLFTSLPQLQDQRKQGILQSGSQFLSSLPVGQHSYGTTNTSSNSTGTNTSPGNMLGGLFGNLGTSLAGLYGNGAFTPAPNNGGGINPGVGGATGYNYGNVNTPQMPVAPPYMPPAPTSNPWLPNQPKVSY